MPESPSLEQRGLSDDDLDRLAAMGQFAADLAALLEPFAVAQALIRQTISDLRTARNERDQARAALVTLRSMKAHLPYEAVVTIDAALTQEGSE